MNIKCFFNKDGKELQEVIETILLLYYEEY